VCMCIKTLIRNRKEAAAAVGSAQMDGTEKDEYSCAPRNKKGSSFIFGNIQPDRQLRAAKSKSPRDAPRAAQMELFEHDKLLVF